MTGPLPSCTGDAGSVRACWAWPTPSSGSTRCRPNPGTCRCGEWPPNGGCTASTTTLTRTDPRHELLADEVRTGRVRHRGPQEPPGPDRALGRGAQLPGPQHAARPDAAWRSGLLL